MTQSIEYGTGRYSTASGRAIIRSIVATEWDGGDLQFSALEPAFALCDSLAYLGLHVPDECEYHPGAIHDPTEDSDIAAELMGEWEEGRITDEDMQYWARVLIRYVELIPADRRY